MIERNEIVNQVAAFLTSVATRNQCLLDAFSTVVNALNNRDWPTVESKLDANVTLTTLNPPVTITPKGPVEYYIEHNIAPDNPIFVPLSINVNSTTGQVSGRAKWYDNDNGVPTVEVIKYWFTFIMHPDGKCYLIYLSGTPD
jgi:hypothetical protein